MGKYKKLVFQASIRNSLFGKLLFPVITWIYFRLENFVFFGQASEIFLKKYRKFFLWAWKRAFRISTRNFSLIRKLVSSSGRVPMFERARLLQFRLLLACIKRYIYAKNTQKLHFAFRIRSFLTGCKEFFCGNFFEWKFSVKRPWKLVKILLTKLNWKWQFTRFLQKAYGLLQFYVQPKV